MARRLVRRFLPAHHQIREHRLLRLFGTLLHDPNLWHLNRHSVAGSVAIGLFWAAVPMPFQMLPSAACAILFRTNLAIAVVMVWATNPITIPPFFFFCYMVGTWILQTPPQPVEFALSFDWLMTELHHIWKPFLLGCLLVGSTLSASGYFGVRALWRWHVVRDWQRRRARRKKKARAAGTTSGNAG